MTEQLAFLFDTRSTADVLSITLFRVIPFLAFSALKLRHMPATATCLAISAIILATSANQLAGPKQLVLIIMGLGYFVAVAASLHHFVLAPRRGDAAKRWLFPLVFLGFVAVPAVCFPFRALATALLVAHGFELSMAAYSYGRSILERGLRPSLGGGLSFLLINPELVFPAEATVCLPSVTRGAGRALLGCLLLWSVTITRAFEPIKPALEWHLLPAGFVHGGAGFVALYGLHSGLAHTQIGLCRMIGLQVPERYDQPFIAVSPREFWRRWNRYAGTWLRSYLYQPMVRSFFGLRWRAMRHGAATLGAFLCIGALHDTYWLFAEGRVTIGGMAGFGVWGLLLWIWSPVDRMLVRSMPPWRRAILRQLSRLAFVTCLCLNVWAFL